MYTVIGSVQPGCEALILKSLLQEERGFLTYLAPDNRSLYDMKQQLAFFLPSARAHVLPAWDCLPYDRLSPSAGIVGDRMQALRALRQIEQKERERATEHDTIFLVCAQACLQRMVPKNTVDDLLLTLKAGQEYNHGGIVSLLVEKGYQSVRDVFERGQFALRGNILDIFPAQIAVPYRLDFFGDTLEKIKQYNLEDQKVQQHVDVLNLYPAREITGVAPIGFEHNLSDFYPTLACFFDYLPQGGRFVCHAHAEKTMQEFERQIQAYYQARLSMLEEGDTSLILPYKLEPPEKLYLSCAQVEQYFQNWTRFTLSPFTEPEREGYKGSPSSAIPSFFLEKKEKHSSLERVARFIQEHADKNIIISCRNQRAIDRLKHMFREFSAFRAPVTYACLGFERGFIFDNILIITESDIFGEQIIAKASSQRRAAFFHTTSFARDDFIVHKDHGVGLFKELATLTVQGKRHDFLLLVYEGGDKLYVPVENADLLSRYGHTRDGVVLDKLGSSSFRLRAARLKAALENVAQDIISLAARRRIKPAAVFEPAFGLWEEFCARFPYVETQDQERAIADVLQDLSRGYPMDRLICGDVGFGKTEVAMRASMAVAASGGQVAIITPTSILARQHVQTFTKRFVDTPLCIKHLSRLISPSEAKLVKQQLQDGKIDIIIGTHALLSKDVVFKNLSLLVVDEEQHFGVAHKERLKALRDNIHVLTLTATPIPRTLQMSFTGIKDLSIIAMPPVDRHLTKTYVTPFDGLIIREALLREHDRSGKSFYVTPRITDIPDIEAFLAKYVPSLRITSVHGRMLPTQIDRKMNDFYEGLYDVLISTTIIESGLDIPQANTIIVHRSHMFGLSQLYQLRGRVGRSKEQAYCYLTTPTHETLQPGAEQRLRMLQSLDSFGSSFTLASHDLDMRGAGNLLGHKQSGHMKDVGCELYQSMLEEAIQALQAQGDDTTHHKKDMSWSPTIQLDLPILLPETYVPDVQERISFYQQLSHASTPSEIGDIQERLLHRFGPLCEEVVILIKVTQLKNACKQACIEKIKAEEKNFSFLFKDNACPWPDKLFTLMTASKGKIKITPQHKVIYTSQWPSAQSQLDFIIEFVGKLNAL